MTKIMEGGIKIKIKKKTVIMVKTLKGKQKKNRYRG